tara:strand:+ start:3082 stop:3840 length:759 start_codon:yes stop_codon:yes gene_type:complete
MKENFLTIASYNLFWKIMNHENCPIELKKYINVYEYKENILSNILNTYNYLNPNIFCFQEASDYKSILLIFNKKKYKYHINISDKDVLLTVWDITYLKLIKFIDGEFEQGRPFTIFLFLNLKFSKYFIFINVHASHNNNTFNNFFKPIQKELNNNFDKFKIKRIIISGDFNRDINLELKKNNYYLKINDKKKNFKSNINDNKTCCDIFNKKYQYNSDQVIDTKSKEIKTFLLDKFNWYKRKSSDHKMILSIV